MSLALVEAVEVVPVSAALEALHLTITKPHISTRNHSSWLAAKTKVIYLTILLK